MYDEETDGILKKFIGSVLPTKPYYQVELSPDHTRLIVNINGYQMSNVIDRGYFVKEWFTPVQLDTIPKAEDSTQNILKTRGPRKFSGGYHYSHIDRVVENAFKIAEKANIPLDFITLLTLILHDNIEDHPNIRELMDEFEETLIHRDQEKRDELSEKIMEERISLRDGLEKELLDYAKKTGIKGSERYHLKKDIISSVSLVYGLTRFSDKNPYAISMARQYMRKGNERLRQTLRRAIVKNCDRISNNEEIFPLKNEIMKQIIMALKDEIIIEQHEVGKYLKGKFGEINPKSKVMPASVGVRIGANSIHASQYSGYTINKYAKKISESKDETTQGLFGLGRLSRSEMIKTTSDLEGHVISVYEEDKYVQNEKPRIDRRIQERKEGTYYDKATLLGPIERWLIYDAGGRKFIESLDNTPEQRLRNYEDARNLMELIPKFDMFYDPATIQNSKPEFISDFDLYDPKKHFYFTLKGLENMTGLLPDFWELVADLKAPDKDSKKATSMLLL